MVVARFELMTFILALHWRYLNGRILPQFDHLGLQTGSSYLKGPLPATILGVFYYARENNQEVTHADMLCCDLHKWQRWRLCGHDLVFLCLILAATLLI